MPEPGTRLRVTARMPERGRWIGPLVSVAHDTITIRDGDVNGSLVVVPTQVVTRLEVSRGRGPSGLWMGAGAVAGAVVGGGFALLAYQVTQPCCTSGGGAVQTAVGAAIGGGVGYAIGRLPRSERWRTLPLEQLRGTWRH